MINNLKELFPKIIENRCRFYVNDEEFFIYDCESTDEEHIKGCCYISSSDGQFKVINNSLKNIGFIAIDKCMFFDDDNLKKADCIVFDDTTICFVEIKDCKLKQRSKRQKDAVLQLKSTINIFKNNIEFDKKIEAYLCIGFTHTMPSILASDMTAQVEFESDLDTTLFKGCQKSFL